MPRIASLLLLALIVVGAQQAALLHEIGHGLGHGAAAAGVGVAASDRAQAGQGASKETASAYCEKCFQFAHVCAAGCLSPVTLGVIAAWAQAVRAGQAADLPGDRPPARSRGPPVIL